MNAMLATVHDKTIWMPEGASTFAADLDWTFYFIYWVSVFFFVLIGACMFYFAWRYRQVDKRVVKHGSHHNNALEITWSVIPLIIVLAIFIWGFRGFLDMRTSPGEAYEIQVMARKWSWEFTYPEGVSSPILHIPADTPVRLVMTSADVIHSVFIPAFRAKMDVVPGRHTRMWFQTPWDSSRAQVQEWVLPGSMYETGEIDTIGHPTIVYDLYCTEYCGTRHSWMWSKVVVHRPEDWAALISALDTLPEDPVEAGMHVYTRRGCVQCHSVDGASGIGPTFRNLFGSTRPFADGTSTVADENYIRESVAFPGRRVVQGFANVMPTTSLRDHELEALIAWMKIISEHSGVIQPGVEAQDTGELPPQTVPDRQREGEGGQGIVPDPQ